MTTGMFLEADEIAELTQRKHRKAQAAMLNALGIEHRVRPDGSIAILRAHVEKEFGIRDTERKAREVEPNWDAM